MALGGFGLEGFEGFGFLRVLGFWVWGLGWFGAWRGGGGGLGWFC